VANVRGIKRRLVSVTNTKKITYAMKLVSAAKLRTAQAAVMNAKQYAAGLTALAKDVLADIDLSDVSHPLTEKRSSIKKVAVLVIGGSRGLCGGYNSNVNKRIIQFERELASKTDAPIEYIVIGKKPADFLRRLKRAVTVPFDVVSEDPTKWPLEDLCQTLKDRFLAHDFDELYVGFTKFKSALSQTPVVELALPYSNDDVARSGANAVAGGLTLFEPSKIELFSALIPRLFMAQVLAASLEAKTGEHASRMVAMDGATKNCGELIDNLRITINKLRQAQITSQLLDIIGGAEAVQ
jgi:F-type H+-transporting ATPase subunit gamma